MSAIPAARSGAHPVHSANDETGTIVVLPGEAERDPRTFLRRRRRQELALSIATPIVFLIAWEVAARFGLMDKRFFPAPSNIFDSAMDMASSGVLVKDLLASLARILAGFALGVVTGLAGAIVLGLSRLTRAALEPFLSALYTVPKLALLPLLLLIFGLGEFPKMLLVAMTVFFYIWITCMEAILSLPESYREAAQSFGARGWSMFRHVTWPYLLPQLFIAMRLAIGAAVLVIVGVEFVQADEGVGYRIWHSWSLFQANRMYVGICTVAVLGFLLGFIVKWVGRLALPWQRREAGKD
jgi:NitT/TauT family transport system permease protein/sulfonate transport system permease protein